MKYRQRRILAYLESGRALKVGIIAYISISFLLLSFAIFTFMYLDDNAYNRDSFFDIMRSNAGPLLWAIHIVGLGLICLLLRKCRQCRIGPGQRITKALGKMGKGDLGCKIILRRHDELADVADSISQASQSLAHRIGNLQMQTRQLAEVEDFLADSLTGKRYIGPEFLKAMRKLKICTNRLNSSLEEFQISAIIPPQASSISIQNNTPVIPKQQVL